jgi:large subunit ribosomal protein L1
MFAGGEMATKAKAAGIDVIDPATIEDIAGNRQQARKIANKSDFFLSEIPHMGTVGRFLGVVLGPRGKMPRPVPPNLDPGTIAAVLKDTAVVRSRDRITFHTAVGSREQGLDDLTTNAMAVWNRVTGKLDRGAGNIRSCYIKTSMGPSIKVEVIE